MKKKQTTRPTAVTPREFVITSPLIIDQLTTQLAILPIENVELVGGDTAQENQTAVITAEVTPSHPEDLFRWYLDDRALALQPQNKLHLMDVPLSLDGMTIKCMVMRPGEQGTLKITAETTLQIAPQLPNIVRHSRCIKSLLGVLCAYPWLARLRRMWGISGCLKMNRFRVRWGRPCWCVGVMRSMMGPILCR